MSIPLSPKPFLKWAGSKKKLLPNLKTFWDRERFNRYIEPFVGSAQLYFSLNPKSAILNDINSELINTYKVIRDSPSDLFKQISTLPRDKEFYYEIRRADLTQMTNIEKAARFIYLNKLCFNGLYRTNLKGEFNVPFSASKPAKFPTEDELLAVSRDLENTLLLNEDFEIVLRQYATDGDFVYMDPPYALANSRIFYQYDACTFGLEDIKRLKSLLDLLDNRGVKFLLSYAASEDIIEHFNKWNIHEVMTLRNIAGFSKNRRKEAELLISNCYE